MCWNSVLPILPKIIGAVAGTIMVSVLSMYIVKLLPVCTKILTAVGKETFVILAFAEISIVLLNYFFDFNVAIKYLLLTLILVACVEVKKVITTKIISR